MDFFWRTIWPWHWFANHILGWIRYHLCPSCSPAFGNSFSGCDSPPLVWERLTYMYMHSGKKTAGRKSNPELDLISFMVELLLQIMQMNGVVLCSSKPNWQPMLRKATQILCIWPSCTTWRIHASIWRLVFFYSLYPFVFLQYLIEVPNYLSIELEDDIKA